MPKESKTTSHNKKPYPESSAAQPITNNGKKSVEFVWESYEQQSPLKSKQNFASPSNSSSGGGMTQLLGFPDDDPMNGFSFSSLPSSSSELVNCYPTQQDNDHLIINNNNKLSPPNTTAEDPFKKHNDLSSLTSASFHIACTACREKHIKCDKKLPHCTYCIKHGLTCQYRKPKKRGRPSTKNKNGQSTEDDVISEMNGARESNNRMDTFPNESSATNQNFQLDEFAQNSGDMNGWFFNNQQQQQHLKQQQQSETQLSRVASSSTNNNPIMLNETEIDMAGFSQMPNVDFNNESLIALIRMSRDLNKQLMKRLTVDDYYRSTSMPLIDQRSVEQIFFSEKRSAEANCFLYSIHMLMCQRRGFKEESERAYEKTRVMLSSVFDQWRSFLTACTYCNLSIYCSGEGNDADAVFYLSFVDYYFSQLKEKFSLGQQNLRYLKSIAEMAAGVGVCSEKPINDSELDEVDAESLSKQCHHDVANLLVGFYKYTTGKKKVPPELLQITSQTINQDTIFLYLTLFDMITKLVTQHEANRQKSLTPEQEEISKAICDAFINGTRVLILQQCGYKGKVLEDAANRIAEIFSNEISIGFASPLYMSSVIATCQVHIAIIEEIESGVRNNFEFGVDYYSMIDRDIKSMNYLEKQFGRVRKRYSQIIYRLESIKRRREMEVSKLVVNEIERLKSMRSNDEGKINFDKSFLSQEHLSSIYTIFHNTNNNNGEGSSANLQQQPSSSSGQQQQQQQIFINIPNVVSENITEVPNFGRNLEDNFDDILNNL